MKKKDILTVVVALLVMITFYVFFSASNRTYNIFDWNWGYCNGISFLYCLIIIATGIIISDDDK